MKTHARLSFAHPGSIANISMEWDKHQEMMEVLRGIMNRLDSIDAAVKDMQEAIRYMPELQVYHRVKSHFDTLAVGQAQTVVQYEDEQQQVHQA